MRWVVRVAIAAAAIMLLSGGSPVRLADREIVVFEVRNCVQCKLFRRDIIEPYFESNRGAILPMQVVDYDLLGTAGRGLKRPIETLPTSVIMSHGREIGRVTGNPGTGRFMLLIDGIIADFI